MSYGPQELGLRQNVVSTESPEVFVSTHPQLFKTGTTSRDEGYFYWAMLKIIGPEGKIGQSGLVWYYQSKVMGGRNLPGGAVLDFYVERSGYTNDIGIRIVTPYRHTQAGPLKQGTDFEQMFSLVDNDIQPVDVFSRNYINDKTGRAVILSARRAITASPDYSPIYHRFFGVSS